MKRLIIFIFSLLLVEYAYNQKKQSEVLDGVYVKEHVPARKPVPYHHLREADVMWGKKIWRMLDLREKINLPLYFPTKPMDDRYSLTDLLLYGIENEGLVAYSDIDDEFTTPTTIAQINTKLGARIDTTQVEDPETGQLVQKIVTHERKVEQVTRYLMKEYWFFDKQRSMLEVRIIGLCPLRVYEREATQGEQEKEEGEEKDYEVKQVMWVYFPAARPLFANHEVFNPYNDSERRTFDDIFFKRRFSSFIFKETNVYNNREIWSYKQGLDAMLEAERIKEFIFKFEHDLWEY
ncbi:MAG: gliding motility protein GldN [Bacteroidales bacterium]|nr:gliding motility protein GldN [Bacteroidales bacterium]